MQQLEILLSEFSSAFYEDNFKSMSCLHSKINEMITTDTSLQNLSIRNPEYQKYTEDSLFFESALSHLRNSDWQPVSTLNEIIVESLNSGADFYTKASVLIHSNIIPTLSVINETDLLPLWIHALSQVQVLDSTSKMRKFMKYNFWFPWPLTNRECFLDFSAYPVAEEQSIMILMRSPVDKYMNFDIPQPVENIHRMIVPMGCILVKSILPSLIEVTIMVQANSNVDYSPSFLPEWLLEFGKKQMMYFLMDALRITVHNFGGSEYENRINQKTEFYNFLRGFISNYLDVVV